MTETQELVTKLLSEGAKEFPHQWDRDISDFCLCCREADSCLAPETECPVLLRAALDLTRQQLAEALDPTVRE